ncbi:MAG TPA: hypothetical protein IAC12_01160 [Candidatus Aphodovivens avistercoris]|nr:hypothetical protein [Candidatus Aphodovivens avistercoris]
MDAKRNARDDQAKGAALRSELMRGGKRKVPRKILVAAVAGLLLCVAVIVGVVLAFSAFGGRDGSVGADDIPPLLSVEGNQMAADDPIDADQVVYLRISNYPDLSFEPPGTALASDRELVQRACDLLSGARFSRWDGYARYEEETQYAVGGFSSSLALLDADRNVLLKVGYDPGMANYDSDAEGLYVNVGDQRCVMEGDQRAVSDFIQECVDSALAEYEDGVSGDYYDFDPTVPRTWVSEDDLDAYESAQPGASASAA